MSLRATATRKPFWTAGKARAEGVQFRSSIDVLRQLRAPMLETHRSGSGAGENGEKRPAMILDIQPIAHVLAIPVDGQWLAFEGVQDN